jgi:hypothetical protein
VIKSGIRNKITKKGYHVLKHLCDHSKKAGQLQQQLPVHLHHSVDAIIAPDKAQLLWNARVKITMMAHIQACISFLHIYFANTTNLWEQPISLIISRDLHSISIGDGSKLAGINNTQIGI